MKRFKYLILMIIGLFVFNLNVYAASANLSVSSSSVYDGDSFDITVNVNSAAAWNIHTNTDGPVEGCVVNQADASSDANDTNKAFTASCKATGEGTITITLSGDVTGATDADATNVSDSKTVSVTSRPQVAPQPVKPDPDPEPEKVEEVKKIIINKFEIVGYPIDFKTDVFEYSIDVLEGVDELYIIVEGENFDVTGNNKVTIKDLNEISVKFTNDNDSKEYKIKINRIKKVKEEKKEDKKENNDYDSLIAGSAFLALAIIVFGLSVRSYIKKK